MHEEEYWQAVLERDCQANNTFVYAVRSTGIYCRPTCPARRPQREQVLFFAHSQAAEEAGFRPCRRCQPHLGKSEAHLELVEQACHYIEQHLDEPLHLSALGSELGLSLTYTQRLFKRVMGITPRQYAEAQRLQLLKRQLKEGTSVTQSLYEVGYSSSSRLYERSPRQLGMTPATYQRGGAGMVIEYTIVDSPLGRLLVAATQLGVCYIGLHESDAVLEATLRQEYPAASLRQESLSLQVWLEEVVGYLQSEQPHLNLPVDLRATAFQWRVWEELRKIPRTARLPAPLTSQKRIEPWHRLARTIRSR